MVSGLSRLVGLKRMVRISGQSFIAPFYHMVSDEQVPHLRHLFAYPNRKNFERDLDRLLTLFEPVTLHEYLRGLEEDPEFEKTAGRKKPSMLLSFDDGLAECHRIIAPLLREKGIPAIFFLNNHFIDNKGLFYRYKASLLMEEVLKDPEILSRAAAFLHVSEPQVPPLLMTVSYTQQILLDRLAGELAFSFSEYQRTHPVYMTTPQIRQLIGWGFEIGAHSLDHPQMDRLESGEVVGQVLSSAMDLQERFRVPVRGFAFPFSSAGIPGPVIRTIIKQGITLFGISGIRETGEPHYIQRIDMEKFRLPARNTLEIKFLHYNFRKLAGRPRMDF